MHHKVVKRGNDVEHHLRYQIATLHLSNKLRSHCLRRPHADASPAPELVGMEVRSPVFVKQIVRMGGVITCVSYSFVLCIASWGASLGFRYSVCIGCFLCMVNYLNTK